jgi:hypothetical protein
MHLIKVLELARVALHHWPTYQWVVSQCPSQCFENVPVQFVDIFVCLMELCTNLNITLITQFGLSVDE